jgi:hypothetical protein
MGWLSVLQALKASEMATRIRLMIFMVKTFRVHVCLWF